MKFSNRVILILCFRILETAKKLSTLKINEKWGENSIDCFLFYECSPYGKH